MNPVNDAASLMPRSTPATVFRVRFPPAPTVMFPALSAAMPPWLVYGPAALEAVHRVNADAPPSAGPIDAA
jgi:hypothetical protein